MPRRWATAATPAVRQLASPERTISTGVGALSSDAKTFGWSASTVNVLSRDCSAPRPKKPPITERLCVPVTHSQLVRHLNWAASGAFSSASRAPNSASTLTPLLIFAALEPVVSVILFSGLLNCLRWIADRREASRRRGSDRRKERWILLLPARVD